MSDNWAETYKNWMQVFLADRQVELTKRILKIQGAIITSGDLEKDGKETAEGVAFKQLGDVFGTPGQGSWEWKHENLLDFSDEAVNAPPLMENSYYRIERCDTCVDPAPVAPPPSPTPQGTIDVLCIKSADCQTKALIDWCATPNVSGCYQMSLDCVQRLCCYCKGT